MQSLIDDEHKYTRDFVQNKRSSRESPWKEIKESIRLSEELEHSHVKLLPKSLKFELHSKASEQTSIVSPLGQRFNKNNEASSRTIPSMKSSTSNATIFSCNREGMNGRNNGYGSIKRARSQLNRSYSAASSLKRSNAIRFKRGSWIYRLQVALSKFLKKLKYWKSTFVASSKRIGSTKKRPVNIRTKRMSFPFKTSTNKLRQSTKEKFKHAPNDDGKFIRLDKITIALSASVANGDANESRDISRNNSSLLLPKRQEPTNSAFLSTRNLPVSSSRSMNSAKLGSDQDAPAPPPHLIPIKQSPTFKYRERVEMKERTYQLWNSYLKQVVFKRIQLRQEIAYYQQTMENYSSNVLGRNSWPGSGETDDEESDIDQSDDNMVDGISEDSDRELAYVLAREDIEETLSQNSERRTSQIMNDRFNRQSVLGEMLGLQSPDSILITTNTNTDVTNSFAPLTPNEVYENPNPGLDYTFGIGKSYSTLRKTLIAPYMRA